MIKIITILNKVNINNMQCEPGTWEPSLSFDLRQVLYSPYPSLGPESDFPFPKYWGKYL